MALSKNAQSIYSQISSGTPKFGDLKKIGKTIKRDHDLAMELWSTGEYFPRLLAVLIMDKKMLTQELMDDLASDLSTNDYEQRNLIADWLLANQLMKSKKTTALIESWDHHPSPILRRLFWYHQARLRWTGQNPPDNTSDLLTSLETNMETAEPEVQWAMNFSAGQIGIHEPTYRDQCIKLGERVGLYKDDPVPRGCTPSYLPEFIRIEAAKWEK
ncbi:MAG: DNA alkylation repair protein [Chloroflexota bacterium]